MATKGNNKSVKLIKTLEDLSIWAFDKCINGDLTPLILSKDKTITKKVNSKWKELYNEFCKINKSNSAIRVYVLASEIKYLESKLMFSQHLCNMVLKSKDLIQGAEIIEEIMLWGYSINLNNNAHDEIRKVLKLIKYEGVKLKRKIAEYEDLINKKHEPISIYKQKIKLQLILKIDIDIKKCNVIEWLTLWDEAKAEINRQNKKNG